MANNDNTVLQQQANKALARACESGNIEAIRLLLAAGADVNARRKNGSTPLHCACAEGHTAIVRLLLEHGADIGARNDDGHSPLHIACFHGRTDIIRLLMEKGADVNARDEADWTPLDMALNLEADNPAREEILDLFREHHPDLVMEAWCTGK